MNLCRQAVEPGPQSFGWTSGAPATPRVSAMPLLASLCATGKSAHGDGLHDSQNAVVGSELLGCPRHEGVKRKRLFAATEGGLWVSEADAQDWRRAHSAQASPQRSPTEPGRGRRRWRCTWRCWAM